MLTILAPTSELFGQEQGDRVSISPRARRAKSAEAQLFPTIRVGVNLVLVPVLVTDPYDRPVLGLEKDAFHIFEDGIEQNITYISTQERPSSVGIIFDASASMRQKMDESVKALSKFLSLSMPGDEFFLDKFADRAEAVCGFTQDIEEIEDNVSRIRPSGWTALFDAIGLGLKHMKRAKHDRRVLLILSDGEDNNSRHSEREIRSLVQEGNVRVFAISVLSRSPALEKLAAESGGRAFRVRKLEDLQDVAEKISEQVHHEYVLGYYPAERAPDGKFRKLRVQTVPAQSGLPLHTSWRQGYYGPWE